MSRDEEDLSAEPLQLQPYTADARSAQLATAVECWNVLPQPEKINVWQPITQHTGIMMNLEICSSKIIRVK